VYNKRVKFMSFTGINLSSKMVSSLNRQKYFSPSNIQQLVIPKALRGETLLAQSATGTGKTLCFIIPIIEKLDLKNQSVQAVIIAPTRELASQIFDAITNFQKDYPELKVRLFKSGEERENSLKGLSVAPHILIGTPGRLKDVLSQNVLSLSHVQTVVLDEADMLLKEGFFGDIDVVVSKIKEPQFLVFSATLEATLAHELERYIGPNTPVINEDTMTSSNVEHYLVDIGHQNIDECVEDIIQIISPYLMLIFASKKDTANKVFRNLKEKKYKVGLLTGDLSSRERKNVLKMIKNEQIYILVCSDMAARGLDIPDVTDILNIDLPSNLDFYYHRAGRTGRFDKKGNCYTFYNNEHTAKPLALVNQGVNFAYRSLRNHKLSEGKPVEKTHPTRRKIDTELDKQIRIITAKSKSGKKVVKPGYKRKVREEIAKAKQKHRREIIRQDIRRQRVERYKKEGRENG